MKFVETPVRATAFGMDMPTAERIETVAMLSNPIPIFSSKCKSSSSERTNAPTHVFEPEKNEIEVFPMYYFVSISCIGSEYSMVTHHSLCNLAAHFFELAIR